MLSFVLNLKSWRLLIYSTLLVSTPKKIFIWHSFLFDFHHCYPRFSIPVHQHFCFQKSKCTIQFLNLVHIEVVQKIILLFFLILISNTSFALLFCQTKSLLNPIIYHPPFITFLLKPLLVRVKIDEIFVRNFIFPL